MADISRSFQLNHELRVQRRERLAGRLREHFVATKKASDKVAVSLIRSLVSTFETNISKEECGRIVRQAFPDVYRKRSNCKWFYFGLMQQQNDGNVHVSTPESRDFGDMSNKPSSPKEDTSEHGNSPNVVPACGEANKCSSPISKKDQNLTSVSLSESQPQHLKPFCIASLNLCKEEMSDLSKGEVIGEGTFGICIAGTYKGVPAAFKIFKDTECLEDIHAEAKILLKIPSHPGIPMLIGVHTSSKPFVLATKLCETGGRPDTYAAFLNQCEGSKTNLSTVLQLLLHVGEAISHLFSVNILHNDIKGNNVVLEDSDEGKKAVLIDFGKACSFENAKESIGHKLMRFDERRQYRERYPHIAPERSNGERPTTASDIYSFGHMFCLTLKEFKNQLGDYRKDLLDLGKAISHFRPHKRPQVSKVVKELSRLNGLY